MLDILPFPAVIDEVRKLCAQGQTGTVFIVSRDERLAQIQLERGAVVMLLCRGRRGDAAIMLMRSFGDARLRFYPNYVAAAARQQLDTSQVLAELSQLVPAQGVERRNPARPFRQALSHAGAESPVAIEVPRPSARQCAELEKLLVMSIGPIAQIIAAELAAQASSARGLADAMAEEISSPEKRRAFLSAATPWTSA